MTTPKKKSDIPRPPSHLKPATKRWYASLVETYVLEPHHLMILRAAAEAWDELQAAREMVRKDGFVVTTKKTGAVHAHPAVRIEANAAIRFARLLRELNLDQEVGAPDASRPPRIGGRKW